MKALRALALAGLVLAALAPGAAPGAPPAPGARQAADQTVEAKARFKKGTDLYRQARYREAIAEFQAAYRLRPHGVLHFNVAQCHEKLGDIPAALASYHDYLREVPGAEDRETVRRAVSNLEARLAATGVQQILVYSEPAGAEVLVDGQSRGRTPFGIVLPHGVHVVSVIKAGYQTVTREVALAPDRSLHLDLALVRGPSAPPPPLVVPLPPPPTPAAANPGAAAPGATQAPAAATAPAPAPQPVARRGGKVWTWVAGGVAVAAAGAGVWYGMQAQDASDKLVKASQPLPPGEAQKYYDEAKSKSKTANILYGVAGAAGAAGVTLFFLEGSF
ncbi:MAG TPA: PEGA domain-containing protein [Anaeromyxobacteraceae bacterium]|nr:PEGA domain-containing protein [Anaeromyxobacteraceae bacterium]